MFECERFLTVRDLWATLYAVCSLALPDFSEFSNSQRCLVDWSRYFAMATRRNHISTGVILSCILRYARKFIDWLIDEWHTGRSNLRARRCGQRWSTATIVRDLRLSHSTTGTLHIGHDCTLQTKRPLNSKYARLCRRKLNYSQLNYSLTIDNYLTCEFGRTWIQERPCN